tara:strand:- start:747 stop:2351 length:1605 start_codon:yes stop_codon:yes gene_type:complete
MADVKISALGSISAVAGEDLVAIVDDPSGTPASRKATITQIATFINTGAITAGSTTTFTNKTIDAEGTGNSISNIDVANLKSGVLDTDLSSVSGSDDTIASAKAVKAYVDAQILTEDTLTELNDTTITSVGDNELLQYDSSSSKWINQTIAEAGLSPVAGSSSIVTTGTIGTGTWQGTAIASAYIAGDAIVASKIADNAIDSEHYTDGSIDLAHMSVNSIDSDQYVDASIDLAHLSADSVNGTKIADDSINSEHIVDGSVDLAHMSVNSIDSDQYVDGSIDLVHLSANSVDSDQYVDGSIDLIHLSANSVDSDQYVDGSIDNIHVATGLDAVKLADGTVTNAELQYINTLSSNAQTQISAKSPTAGNTSLTTVGTIGTGVWNATVIASAKLDADTAHLSTTQTFSGAKTFSALGSFSANIDLVGSNLDNVRNIIHDIETSGTDINFAEDDIQTISISGNTTFSTAGRSAGKSKVLRILADGTDRVCTFPSGIRWLGGAPDSNTYTVTASKYAIVTFTCFDANESGMLGAFALEE